MDGLRPLVESSTSVIMAVQPDMPVERLCGLLIECEQAQHRYQWASGFLLVTLMDKPDAPKAPSAFADWLAAKTGIMLTQKEIQRRVTVYNFYSRFADERIVALVECVGLRTAYHARRAIDHQQPERARAVLQACIDNQAAIDAPPPNRPRRRRSNKQPIDELCQRAVAAAKKFDGQDWVPLALVIDLLAAAGH